MAVILIKMEVVLKYYTVSNILVRLWRWQCQTVGFVGLEGLCVAEFCGLSELTFSGFCPETKYLVIIKSQTFVSERTGEDAACDNSLVPTTGTYTLRYSCQ
jgi:hypothetical protein